MKNAIFAILFAMLALPVAPLRAAQEGDLYSATVAVSDQSEAARTSAAREGLVAVLVKLTGSRTLDNDPRVRTMLQKVATYMVEYSYVTLPAEEPGVASGLGVHVQYDRRGIDQALRTSKLPIWPHNRPPLLLWIVADEPPAEPRVLNDDETVAAIGRAFARRGLSPVFPLYDLEDQTALEPVNIRDFDSEQIASASKRYPVQGWLAVRVYETTGGQWRAGWMMDLAGQTLLRQVQAGTMEDLLGEVVDQAVDSIASQHSYVAEDSAGNIELDVSGIASYRDYSRLMSLLDDQSMVRRVRILAVEGDRLRLSLGIEGGREQLLDSLSREPSIEHLPYTVPVSQPVSDAEVLGGVPLPDPGVSRVERLRWLPGR